MLYQLIACISLDGCSPSVCNIDDLHTQVIAVGTKDMLMSESKRWRRVASVWAESYLESLFPNGTAAQPRLQILIKEL